MSGVTAQTRARPRESAATNYASARPKCVAATVRKREDEKHQARCAGYCLISIDLVAQAKPKQSSATLSGLGISKDT
jgi:hypothetical protein